MSSNGHFYIALTVHAFKQFTCPWIGLINGSYILHTLSLGNQIVPLSFEFPLQKVSKSNKEIQTNIRHAMCSRIVKERLKGSTESTFTFQESSENRDESGLE